MRVEFSPALEPVAAAAAAASAVTIPVDRHLVEAMGHRLLFRIVRTTSTAT